MSGSPFTWFNSSLGASRIECKLHRALVNATCMNLNLLKGEVLLPSISDHSPLLLTLNDRSHIKAPFRYFNYWAKIPGFNKIIKDAWADEVTGTPLFRVVTKLRKSQEAYS